MLKYSLLIEMGMFEMGSRVFKFIKREPVFLASLVCAGVSMLLVPPDAAYSGYINAEVLCLLFCFMLAQAGMQSCGLLDFLAGKLLRGPKNLRTLTLLLVLLTFFLSMFITNDVALIALVPFTILLLGRAGKKRSLIFTIVLQTAAANLGSMLTPFGNPQNLFLYSDFELSFADFITVLLPFAAVSLAMLCAACLFVRKEPLSASAAAAPVRCRKRLFLFLFLFLLCILCVLHVFPYWVLTPIVAGFFLFVSRPSFRAVDYGLLCTFVCFFIFSGNMGRIPAVQNLIGEWLNADPFGTSVLASQVISNVPAAVLLSGFTDNAPALLAGTNVGGLGTIIASLASVISFRLYMRTENARAGRYLGVFTLVNAAGLAVLCGLYYLPGR